MKTDIFITKLKAERLPEKPTTNYPQPTINKAVKGKIK